jgi:hypothetical protein
MRVAFKEWAAVVDALGSGQQIVILRKGGISEGRRGFQVEHAEFFLFPSYFHQQRDSVIPSAQERFDQIEALTRDPSRVRIDLFAHVVSWRRLESLAAAQRLQGQHIWREDVIESRFNWGSDDNIHALAVRVFRLPQPVDLPNSAGYAGCKSWIELDDELSTEGAVPVLSKEAFNEKLNLFHAALDHGASEDPARAAEPPA